MNLAFWMTVLESSLRLRGARKGLFVAPDGWDLSYFEAGPPDAPSIVLVHGLGTSNLSWARVLLPLAQTHRVVAVDLPGFGHSSLPKGIDHATMSDHARALAQFLQSNHFRNPVLLVGQSMGGWIATKVARRVPDRVRHLVLVNNAGVLYPEIQDMRKVVTPTTQAEVFAFWGLIWYRVPRYYRPFWKGAAAHMQTPNVLKFLESLQEDDFINHDLPKLEVPTSIIWGREDRFIPSRTVDVMLDLLGSTRVYWIPRCGHIPALEQPREFVRLVRGLGQPAPDASTVSATG